MNPASTFTLYKLAKYDINVTFLYYNLEIKKTKNKMLQYVH